MLRLDPNCSHNHRASAVPTDRTCKRFGNILPLLCEKIGINNVVEYALHHYKQQGRPAIGGEGEGVDFLFSCEGVLVVVIQPYTPPIYHQAY
jgi:hypothetical protein